MLRPLPTAVLSFLLLQVGATSLLAQTSVGRRLAAPVGPAYQWDYYQFTLQDWDPALVVTTTQVLGGGVDLYLRKGAKPTRKAYDAVSAQPGTSNESISLNGSSDPVVTSGVWYVGVWRPVSGTNYDISYGRQLIPSQQPGMGATPYDGAVPQADGVSFRVWAPNAVQVHLAGDFNGWSPVLTPLVSEGNGNWSLDVRSVATGSSFRYVIDTGSYTVWKRDPRSVQVTSSVGDSVVVDHRGYSWTANNFSTPAWSQMVIYELHVGTFNDAPGGGPGTFASAALKLDYLYDLGVNVIEVMPVAEFPGDFSWGYNPSDPWAVESAYGGVNGFKDFIDGAHARGMAVIMDLTHNHYGPTDLDMWQFDGWSSGGYGGIYFYNDSRASTPWGDTRPDYTRNEVRQYIRDNVLSWLQDFRLDGLRWDSTSFMRTGPNGDLPEAWSLMQWVNDEIDRLQPWKIDIAEDMWNNEWITKDSGVGGAGYDSQWDAQFVHPIRAAIIDSLDQNRNMWAVRDAITHSYNGDATQRVIYTESHDEVANGSSRVPEEIWPGNASSWYSKKRSTLGAALVLTSPGIPMIFEGQEILEDGYFSDTDPVDWSKLNLYPGIHDLYRDLIRLRRNWFNNTRGLLGQNVNVYHVNDFSKAIAFHRWDQGGPGDDVVVLANFANVAYPSYLIGLPRAGTWRVRFNSDWSGYDPSFGNYPSPDVQAQNTPRDGLPYTGSVSIAPYSVVILSQ